MGEGGKWGGFHFPTPGHPLPQVSEAADGQRRLHSLSISSDTTADSFSSLNPEEVRIEDGQWVLALSQG